MAEFDFTSFENTLSSASRAAFAQVRENHKGETFYCIGLYTSGLFEYLVSTAMTEEGLDKAARAYQVKSRYSKQSLEYIRSSLRWSPCDSPLHLEGQEHFNAVNKMAVQLSDMLYGIDVEQEFQEFADRIQMAICDVLHTLDLEGAFGIGEDRELVFLTMLMGDQDDSISNVGRRLNSAMTFKRFEMEWQKYLQSASES